MTAPNALYFAELSAKVYRQATWIHRRAGVEVLHDRAPWGVTLAFRGTDGIRDSITDIRFAPWYDSRVGWCHAGFLKSTRAIWPSLSFTLRQAFLAHDPVPSLPPSFGLFEHPADATLLPGDADLAPDHPVANYIISISPAASAFPGS